MLNEATGKKDLLRAALTIGLGLGILALFIIAFGGHRFWESLDTYYIRFTDVKNLSIGRPVKYAGIEVGRVLDVSVDPANPSVIRVDVGIEEGFAVYEGTSASISQKGIVGDNYVLLSITGKVGKPIQPLGEIPAQGAADFMEVAASMANMANQLTPKLTEIADSLSKLLRSDNRQQVENMLVEMQKLVRDADSTILTLSEQFSRVATHAEAGLIETRGMVKEVRGGMKSTLTNVESAVIDIRSGAVGALTALQTQSEQVGTAVTVLTKQLQGDLEYDQHQIEEILENTAELTHNLKVLSQSLRERPWQIIYRPDDSKKE